MEAPLGLRITSPQGFHVLKNGFSRAENSRKSGLLETD